MRKWLAILVVGLAGAVGLLAQRGRYLEAAPYEVKSVFPREVSPGRYQQVEQRDLTLLAEEGWELVSVTPFVYLNEERGNDVRKPIVTQTYVAYYFKRVKMQGNR
jgi:hypothetical protein